MDDLASAPVDPALLRFLRTSILPWLADMDAETEHGDVAVLFERLLDRVEYFEAKEVSRG